LLGLAGTKAAVEKHTTPVMVQPIQRDYLGESAEVENVNDLAD
jgi:hypothetical protein